MKLLQSQEWRTHSPACWLLAFTKLDINAGYWQVEITEVDKYKYYLFKKAGDRLALSLYVFLPTACFHLKLLEIVHIDLF